MSKTQKLKREFPKGLSKEIVKKISEIKSEPEWMTKKRLAALDIFLAKPLPTWGPNLSDIDFQDIKYYATAGDQTHNWDDVPGEIRQTFEDIGIPEHEKKFLAGVSTQYESEVIYHKLLDKYSKTGLVFESIDQGLMKYPKLFKKYFGTLIPPEDNKFAALNSAVWSGGSFVYVPKGVKVDIPIETYFRINIENMGQFERTLIIAEEGSEVHYIEGCTAPQYSTNSLHAAVVEIFAHKNARVRYTTIQNWSKNVYNLVTKRALADENSHVEWMDVNIGSKITMKYPSVILSGRKAHGKVLSMALADSGQELDTGAKMIHLAPETSSIIDSRTVSIGNGKATYRGISKITQKAPTSKASVNCDGLLIDEDSKSYAYPYNTVSNDSSTLEHEATVSKISQEKLTYIKSRGISEDEAKQIIVAGYVSPIMNEIPMEYSVEFDRLIEILLKREGKGHQKKAI
ncbi:Fe-S cluster assembly protein SufB [Candidatus Dojkabacteria bacterium]|uniref:Fe-S cluster assembly protein SufB n=1 Tax=Candidatus Dojkabacteria bacterium TaxID=2099670 RepID=A0A955KWC8_9BACT|nr:Fe-S cluster assembly protein SufB [Candidatus Dojkabacteria bacterium]